MGLCRRLTTSIWAQLDRRRPADGARKGARHRLRVEGVPEMGKRIPDHRIEGARMKAAVLREIGTPLSIEDVTLDQPQAHEVLIRTAAVGVCHSDLHFAEGKELWPLPTVLGHEAAGLVEAVGPDVTYVAPGDHVITCISMFCGVCEYCLTGHPSLCETPDTTRLDGAPARIRQGANPINQFLRLSAFAEQMLVHERTLVKIREDFPLDRAALVGCGVTTGLGAVFNTAKVEPGSTVVVIGCGGVGLNCVQGAAIAGAGSVIAVDRVAAKLELAKTFGATDVINADLGDTVAEVISLTGGGAHYTFEAIGLKATIEQSFAMLRSGGTATIIGVVPTGTKLEFPGDEFLNERKVQGTSLGSNRFRVDMPRYLNLYLQGRLKLDELISARIRLDDVNEAFDAIRSGEATRSVILFD
jgi:S-(hydroxymethyl)glutathione dehydrogenase / alcohol dehydrogenase